jgi:CRISPR-associated endonuclease Cas3-HD
MMTPHFFAHSAPDPSRWELLHVHLREVASLAGSFGAKFGAGELAALAGLLHDLGKYDPVFQRRLAGDPVRHDHSIGGARAACERYAALGKLIAPAIAGHHAGLADWLPGDEQHSLIARAVLDPMPSNRSIRRATAFRRSRVVMFSLRSTSHAFGGRRRPSIGPS